MTADNELPDLGDIDTEEKLAAFSDLVPDNPEQDKLRAEAVLSYLYNSQEFAPLDFETIQSVMVGAVVHCSPAWRKRLERGDDMGADMIVEDLHTNIGGWLEDMFASMLVEAETLLNDEEEEEDEEL
jgi:hypothetical protein